MRARCSEQVLDLVVWLDCFALEDDLVEVVLFKLIDLNSARYQVLVEQVLVLGTSLLRECQVVELTDVADVVDREALLELVWQLLHVLLVA